MDLFEKTLESKEIFDGKAYYNKKYGDFLKPP